MKSCHVHFFCCTRQILNDFQNKTNSKNIRSKQAQLFEYTRSYMDEVVRDMNEKAIQNEMGTMILDDFFVRWDDKV